MKNIIKSDLYYYRKNLIYFFGALTIFLIYFGVGAIGVNTYSYKGDIYSLFELFRLILIQNYIIVLVICIILTSVMQGKILSNMFYRYQLTASCTEKVLFSKYLIQYIFNLLFCIVAYGTATIIMSFVTHRNLICEFLTNPYCLLALITETILLLNFTIQTVSIVIWEKNGIMGAIINWFIIATTMLPLLLSNYAEELSFLERISEWLLPGQMSLVGRMEMVNGIFVKSVITSIVKIIVFWLLTINFMKKKEFT